MSGITSGTGVFSGINSSSIIDQLMAIEARPRALIQQRIVQLQGQQAAYLDLNSRINAIKTAASAFRTANTFRLKNAVSSNADVLSATASFAAAAGSYTLRVGRLVSTQQEVSRGFADRNVTAVGAESFTFESARARLDNDVALADFNNGAGVSRGRIVITDSLNNAATVDLSRAVTVQDVLDAINSNGVARVTASVQGGRFVIRDNANGNVTVANGAGYTTADSLGISGTASGTLTGQNVYGLSGNTPLSALNDGNGVAIRDQIAADAHSFVITIAGADSATINVNIGNVYTGTGLTRTASAVSTVGGVIARINEALDAAAVGGVRAQINSENGRIEIVDLTNGGNTITVTENGSTTARDLGILTSATPPAGTLNGRRVLAGLNSVLASSINGGAGVTGDGVLNFTLRDGSTFSVTVDPATSMSDMFSAIQAASGTLTGGAPKVTVALDSKGTGFTITDRTTGTGATQISGTAGADTATSLGIATPPGGSTTGVVNSGNLQKQYISVNTALTTFRNGQGVGTGKIRITDSSGSTKLVDIGTDAKTLGDIISEINSVMGSDNTVRARINARGDGLEFYDTGTGTQRVKVEDQTGTVARSLGVAATATGTGTGALNRIDGTLERTVTFDNDDTLDDIVTKINDAGVGVDAAIIVDGAGVTPYRLSFTSKTTGRDGRFIIDTNGFDLGISTLSKGENALAFLGSGDVANAIAVTSSSNILDRVLPGVTLSLRDVSSGPVTVTVSQNTAAIEEAVNAFVTAFNEAVTRISFQTRYDSETKQRGPLLGDGSINELKSTLYRVFNSRIRGYTSNIDQLSDVGMKIGSDGQISLDTQKFQAALAADPQGVADLFTRRTLANDSTITLDNGTVVTNPNAGTTYSEQGIMAQFEQVIDRYVNSVNGQLSQRQRGISAQIDAQNKRIAAINTRLESRRQILERQFASMENTIGRLQLQQGSLGTLASMAASVRR